MTLPFGWRIRRGLLDSVRPFVQIVADDGVCNKTGAPMKWYGRKWALSEHMTDGEIVQTCFLAVKTAIMHEAMEGFTYKGAMIFNPHYDIDKLVEFASGDVEKMRAGVAA